MNEQEFNKAIYSLQTFLLTYDRKGKNVMRIFDEWLDTTKFIFSDKGTMREVLLALKDINDSSLEQLIVSSEIDIIPDFRDYLKYDNPAAFGTENEEN